MVFTLTSVTSHSCEDLRMNLILVLGKQNISRKRMTCLFPTFIWATTKITGRFLAGFILQEAEPPLIILPVQFQPTWFLLAHWPQQVALTRVIPMHILKHPLIIWQLPSVVRINYPICFLSDYP